MIWAFKNGMRPVRPGEVLSEEYLKPLGMSANALAKALHPSPSRVWLMICACWSALGRQRRLFVKSSHGVPRYRKTYAPRSTL